MENEKIQIRPDLNNLDFGIIAPLEKENATLQIMSLEKIIQYIIKNEKPLKRINARSFAESYLRNWMVIPDEQYVEVYGNELPVYAKSENSYAVVFCGINDTLIRAEFDKKVRELEQNKPLAIHLIIRKKLNYGIIIYTE